MPNTFLLIIFFFIITGINAQSWRKIRATEIYFASFNDTSRNIPQFDYFRKKENLIAVSRDFSKDILQLFSEYPLSFDKIYKLCGIVDTIRWDLDYYRKREIEDTLPFMYPYDTNVHKLKYENRLAVIDIREIKKKQNNYNMGFTQWLLAIQWKY